VGNVEGLFCCYLFFLFSLGALAAGAQFFLLAGGAAGISLRTRNDIDDNLAVVLATLRACSMRDAQGTALAFGKASPCYCMMASPLGGLGAIPAHSNYHKPTVYCRKLQISNLKFQTNFDVLKLRNWKLGVCLELGSWSLEFIAGCGNKKWSDALCRDPTQG